jgi:hypothetical protein
VGNCSRQFIRGASIACSDTSVKPLHTVFPRERRAGLLVASYGQESLLRIPN